MTSFTHNDLAFHDAQALRNLAVEQSQLLVVATQVIKKLEKLVETLTIELGAKHQRTLFAAENLEKMRRLHFGRSSERHENDENSPLFSLFTQLSQHAPSEDDSSKPESKPKPIKRGRTPQKKLAVREVVHTIDASTAEARGLKPWDGQFEESSLITVVPSKIVRIHQLAPVLS